MKFIKNNLWIIATAALVIAGYLLYAKYQEDNPKSDK